MESGRLRLGTWQGVTLFEHRRRPRDREIALHLLGK
ncbi:MAG: YjbQ family protein [Kiloniellales bacterium]